jgi:hypothetical protein
MRRKGLLVSMSISLCRDSQLPNVFCSVPSLSRGRQPWRCESFIVTPALGVYGYLVGICVVHNLTRFNRRETLPLSPLGDCTSRLLKQS